MEFLSLQKDPIPPTKWDHIYDATEEKSGCFETNSFLKKITGSEDSLFLNVFTNNLHPEKPYPVMVYLYGGGFQNGKIEKNIKVYKFKRA